MGISCLAVLVDLKSKCATSLSPNASLALSRWTMDSQSLLPQKSLMAKVLLLPLTCGLLVSLPIFFFLAFHHSVDKTIVKLYNVSKWEILTLISNCGKTSPEKQNILLP